MKQPAMLYACLVAGAATAAFATLTPLAHAQKSAATPVARATLTEQGRWVTESGNLEVHIAPCGAALCGNVTRVISAASMSPGASTATPAPVEPGKLMGLKILTALVPEGGGVWRGKIYNRDKDKTYDCIVELQGPNELKVRGYQFIPLFGKTQVWRRVAG